ncbi:MAG: hypothetical protein OHK0013_01550 [Sandaracinaceae bacterium]
MPTTTESALEPMRVSGIRHLIERAYRESGPLQYVRELFVNAIQAGATRIEFSPEWRAVEELGVYRFMVADDGAGMSAQQMLAYLNTFGGGGKPIGDAHENYGIGSKTSTLPWNHAGVVVLSRTAEDPEGCMVRLRRDPRTGEYGAHRFETDDGEFVSVVRPFHDGTIDWNTVWPSWLGEHGTVVVLLGMTGKEDTFLGPDGEVSELAMKSIALYLNKRIWEIPPGVTVAVQELRSRKRADWARSEAEAAGPAPSDDSGPDRRYNRRGVLGARHYVEHPGGRHGSLAERGTVSLGDGTVIDWYLWEGERPSVHTYAHETGFIAALYENELYDVQTTVPDFRRFGIVSSKVRDRVTLVARPRRLAGGEGVYPDTARSSLRLSGSKRAGAPLPWSEWGDEFARQMPAPIRRALAEALASAAPATIDDPKWRERLADRFGNRWNRTALRPKRGGSAVTTDGGGSGGRGGGGGTRRDRGAVRPGVAKPAEPGRTRGGLPSYRWCAGDELEAGVAAAWQKPDANAPHGCVLLNRDFPEFLELFAYWHGHYPDYAVAEVHAVIEAVYGEAMVGRIAHSEALIRNPHWGLERVENELRSSSALTMAALGLVSEDPLIRDRLRHKLGAKRETVSDASEAPDAQRHMS